nr:MAG TPA: protein of unknown function (DUF4406) [Caudoviricetes sp.]
MKKIFISQPVQGLSEEEIKRERKEIVRAIAEEYGEDTKILGNYYLIDDLNLLVSELKDLANATAAFFARGWQESKRCKIEHDIAEAYGLEIVCD